MGKRTWLRRDNQCVTTGVTHTRHCGDLDKDIGSRNGSEKTLKFLSDQSNTWEMKQTKMILVFLTIEIDRSLNKWRNVEGEAFFLDTHKDLYWKYPLENDVVLLRIQLCYTVLELEM